MCMQTIGLSLSVIECMVNSSDEKINKVPPERQHFTVGKNQIPIGRMG